VRPGGLAEEEDAARDRRAVDRRSEAARPEGGDLALQGAQRRDGLVRVSTARAYRHGSSRIE